MTYSRAKYKENVPWENIENPASSIKYDGAHFYMEIGSDGTPSLISRRPSVTGENLNRSPKLPHIIENKVPSLAGNVYNTELIFTGHSKDNKESHALVSGILNSLPPRAINTQKVMGPVRVVLLDVISPKIDTYKGKIEHLQEVVKEFNKPDIIFMPEIKIGKEAIQKQIEDTRDDGREGVIITSLTTPEKSNFRIKIKHKKTYNLKVVGITQEVDIHGKLKESAGALILADRTGRVVGNVGTGFTKELRNQIWRNKPSWLNSLVQVIAMDPTANKLRSSVYNGLADGEIDTV